MVPIRNRRAEPTAALVKRHDDSLISLCASVVAATLMALVFGAEVIDFFSFYCGRTTVVPSSFHGYRGRCPWLPMAIAARATDTTDCSQSTLVMPALPPSQPPRLLPPSPSRWKTM